MDARRRHPTKPTNLHVTGAQEPYPATGGKGPLYHPEPGPPVSNSVREMFADIAPDYDRTNAVLSLGVHHRWRKKTAKLAGASPGYDVLDCATGTGDLAETFARSVQPGGRVVGIDFVERMVHLARTKMQNEDLDITFNVADALELPFNDDSFDMATIGFGIRNVDDPVACLKEMSRVVKQGGRVIVLEFGQPQGLLGIPYSIYSRHIIPRIGELLTGNREAYEYLPRTQAAFPHGDAFLHLMDQADTFETTQATKLTGGIAWIYTGDVA